METEGSIISPAEIVEMEREAHRTLNAARLRPSAADPTATANAQKFLDTLAANRSGSGNQ
jgi:hypothetical protein